MTRSRSNVLQSARDTLRTAELGLRDLQGGPADRRLAGLRNAVVFGRAVTNVLKTFGVAMRNSILGIKLNPRRLLPMST